jgi:toxin secretion/phage lysis holin
MDFIRELAKTPEWISAKPWVQALLYMQTIDIVFGLLASIKKKRISSTIGWNGFTRKTGTVGIVVMAAIIDQMIHLHLTTLAAMAYIGYEGVSIVEKAGMLGIPVPAKILDILGKLKDPDIPGGGK